jgi:hypothetical protein
MTTTVQGSDLAGIPQGQMLSLILAEMRVHTVLLKAMIEGEILNDRITDLRKDQLNEPIFVRTTDISP